MHTCQVLRATQGTRDNVSVAIVIKSSFIITITLWSERRHLIIQIETEVGEVDLPEVTQLVRGGAGR